MRTFAFSAFELAYYWCINVRVYTKVTKALF